MARLSIGLVAERMRWFCWMRMSCAAVAKVPLLDDDTVRTRHRLYLEDGIEGLAGLGDQGSECRLDEAQQDRLKAWISATLPRGTREVGGIISVGFGIEPENGPEFCDQVSDSFRAIDPNDFGF